MSSSIAKSLAETPRSNYKSSLPPSLAQVDEGATLDDKSLPGGEAPAAGVAGVKIVEGEVDVPVLLAKYESRGMNSVVSGLPTSGGYLEKTPMSGQKKKEDDDLESEAASEEYEQDIPAEMQLLEETANAESVPLGLEERLAWWYSFLPTIKVDLGEQLGANDTLFISAEGLILYFAHSTTFGPDFSHQPQHLLLMHRLETFFQYFVTANIFNYTLIFFDVFETLLTNLHPVLWHFREILRLHCKMNPSRLQSAHFHSFYDPEYAALVDKCQPFAILCEDGGRILPSASSMFCGDDEDEDPALSTIGESATIRSSAGGDEPVGSLASEAPLTQIGGIVMHMSGVSSVEGRSRAPSCDSMVRRCLKAKTTAFGKGYLPLYALMLDSLSKGISVALFYRIGPKGSSVKCHAVVPRASGAVEIQRSLYADLRHAMMCTLPAGTESDTIISEFAEFRNQLPSLDLATVAIAWANKDAVPTDNEEGKEGDDADAATLEDDAEGKASQAWGILFAKCLLIMRHYQSCMSLRERTFALPGDDDENHLETHDGFWSTYNLTKEFFFASNSELLRLLNVALETEKMQMSSKDAGGISDFFDERLLRSIIFSCLKGMQETLSTTINETHFGFEKETTAEFDRMWQLIVANDSASFFPLDFSDIFAFEDNLFVSLNEEFLTMKVTSVATNNGQSSLLECNSDYLITFMKDKLANVRGCLLPHTQIEEEPVENQGRDLLESFYARSEVDPITHRPVWSQGELFDLVGAHIHKFEEPERHLPAWLKKLTGEERIRQEKRWENKQIQKNRLFIRDVSKYFGGIDHLHRPIVLMTGKAASDHPWVCGAEAAMTAAAAAADGDAEQQETSPNAAAKSVVVPHGGGGGKKGKGGKPEKISNKAAEIIAKNKAAAAVKQEKRDEVSSNVLTQRANLLFASKTAKPAVFNNTLLDLCMGIQRQCSNLDNFSAIIAVVRLKHNQLSFLVSIIERSVRSVTTFFTRDSLTSPSEIDEFLHTICLLFRLVHLTYRHYMSLINEEAIVQFQNLLMCLGFTQSAKNLFEEWKRNQTRSLKETLTQQAMSNTNAAKTSKGAEKKKKQVDTVASLSPKLSAHQESQILKQVEQAAAKFELHRVDQVPRKCDFAVAPNTEATFQLKFLGADMERTLGTVDDPRVCFKPDGWQKKLLDVVDRQESVLAVAPTASGKTFVCYYAMEKALRFDNECVVVYVSPTRALAMQVESEILARFQSKTYPSGARTQLCGTLFDTKSSKPLECQILVTIPAMMETLLTSPFHQKWCEQLRYVILDEIHCIGDDQSGRAWESLIQLLPCPFIALSATVGNDKLFADWLQKAQSIARTKPVNFIRHRERYADLETRIFSSDFEGLFKLNPVACIDYQRLKTIKHADFWLTPPDSEELYRAMSAVLKKSGDEKIANEFITNFNCEFYFQGCAAITKRQYARYFENMRYTLLDYVQRDVISESMFAAIVDTLTATAELGSRLNDQPWYLVDSSGRSYTGAIVPPTGSKPKTATKSIGRVTTSTTGLKVSVPDEHRGTSEASSSELKKSATISSTKSTVDMQHSTLKDVLARESESAVGVRELTALDPNKFFSLLRNLDSKSLLPALLFNFNRATASRIFYRLAKKLIQGQKDKFYGSPEAAAATRAANKKRQEEYKQKLSMREMAEKWRTLSKEERAEQGIDEALFIELTSPPPPPPGDIAEEFDPEFFVCDRKTYMSRQEEFNTILQTTGVLSKSRPVSPFLIECLRRGIGLYHDALIRSYRRAVEFLFRIRYLRVVISDAALAVGVNMPCRTTIFAGDNFLLTPLMYRQTAGRAGRRGFDAVGHVVFWDLPLKKVRRLIWSQLPTLSGNFPVSPSLVMKSLQLCSAVSGQISTDFYRSAASAMAKKYGGGAVTSDLPPLPRDILAKIDDSIRKYRKIFEQPLLKVGLDVQTRQHIDINVQYHLRFAADLLRRMGLIGPFGQPTGVPALVTSLDDTQPANLFFHHLLMSGTLWNLARDAVSNAFDENPDIREKQLADPNYVSQLETKFIQILATAFGRIDYTHAIVRRLEIMHLLSPAGQRAIRQRANATTGISSAKADVFDSTFHPLMPPIDPQITEESKKLADMWLKSLLGAVRSLCASSAQRSRTEYRLPVTGVDFHTHDAKMEKSPFTNWISERVVDADAQIAISPFAAISGKPDSEFKSVESLVYAKRPIAYLDLSQEFTISSEMAQIPIRDPRTGETQLIDTPLINSYLLDIFTHEKLRNIIQSNSIPAAEGYFIIQDFVSALGRLTKVLDSSRWSQPGLLQHQKMNYFVNEEPLLAAMVRIRERMDRIFQEIKASV